MSLVQKLYNNIFTKGLFSSLANTNIENGKVRVTTDTRQIFLDDDGERKELSSFIKGMTESEIRDLLAPLPKFYYSSDSHKILYYDATDGWVEINAGNAEFAQSSLNALYATNAASADYATTAASATNADHATSATTADSATTATYADEAGIAGIAISLEWGTF